MVQVSVIICTYNRRELVARAVESALGQEGITVEVIVVDDKSTDGTPDFLRSTFGSSIKVVESASKMYVAKATNLGRKHASGDFIALLGDDDYWSDKRKVVDQIALLDRTGAVLCGTYWKEGSTEDQSTVRHPKVADDLIELVLSGGGVVCGSTALIRTAGWDAAGGLDEVLRRGTDSDLFRRIIVSGGALQTLPRVTTFVDVAHGGVRMTNQRGLRVALNNLKTHSWILWRYKSHYFRKRRALFLRVKYLIAGIVKPIIGWNR